jgi:integrase
MDTWLAAARTSVRPQTWKVYDQYTRTHIIPSLGRTKLRALRPDAIQAFYASKLADGLAPNTVRKIHAVLHRALKMAVKWNYLPRNVADDADKPAAARREASMLDPAELKGLLERAVAEGERGGQGAQQMGSARQWAVLWTVAIYSGCRESELLALFWSDLDLDDGTLTVRRNLVTVKDQVPHYGEPKSQTSRRTISMPAEAIQALRIHKRRQAAQRLASIEWAENDLVFCTHIGTSLIRRNVLRAFKQALVRAGLPESVRFHDLRHAHATLVLRAGVPLKIASGRLGHSGIGITADLYQHVSSDMDADAADRAAAAMRLMGRESPNSGRAKPRRGSLRST